MGNIYYDPQAFGLEVVGEFEWTEPCWSFDTLAVWKQKRGQYWIGQDAGCSCPSPFEDVTDINELDGPYDKAGLRKRLDWLINDRVENGYGCYPKAQLRKYASEILSRI